MKLDKEFIRDIQKIANGDGSREAKFAFLRFAQAAAKELSKLPDKETFNELLKKYGRVSVAVCVAATMIERKERLSANCFVWANSVITTWTNRPRDLSSVIIRDEHLHPTRIEEYTRDFLRLTMEEV